MTPYEAQLLLEDMAEGLAGQPPVRPPLAFAVAAAAGDDPLARAWAVARSDWAMRRLLRLLRPALVRLDDLRGISDVDGYCTPGCWLPDCADCADALRARYAAPTVAELVAATTAHEETRR